MFDSSPKHYTRNKIDVTHSYLFSGQLSVAVWVNLFEYIYNWRSSFNFEQFNLEYKSSTCKRKFYTHVLMINHNQVRFNAKF